MFRSKLLNFSSAIVLIGVMCSASAQVEQKQKLTSSVSNKYSNVSLAFRYTPPGGMHDKTERFRQELREYAESIHSSNILGALLAMSSGPDDKDPNWGSITVETYPRSQVQNLDDVGAEVVMSGWVAHADSEPQAPKMVEISGQQFAVSLFGSQIGDVRKGAVVWTTIRKGQLLSFAFAANSPEVLKTLAESMKTVQFY